MKQILQSLKTGSTEVADVPCPGVVVADVIRNLWIPGRVQQEVLSLLERRSHTQLRDTLIHV